jgi:hypothetical protein
MRQQRRGFQLDWGKATPPSRDSVVDYATLEPCPAKETLIQELLNKIAIVKLNGGLGTSMGCKRSSKSAIHVRGGLSFLDLCVRAVEHLNTKHSVDVPLLLMNSFRYGRERRVHRPLNKAAAWPFCARTEHTTRRSRYSISTSTTTSQLHVRAWRVTYFEPAASLTHPAFWMAQASRNPAFRVLIVTILRLYQLAR